MRNNVAQTTTVQSNRAHRLLTAARLYLNSPAEFPQNRGQINRNLNDYHSNPMEIINLFSLPDITDWRRYQEKLSSRYTDLSNVARDRFPVIPHAVGLEASSSLRRDVIGWRQSNTPGETVHEKVVVRMFAPAFNGMLAGDDPELDPISAYTVIEMKREAK
jgi:hypothetical protein